MWLLVTLHAMLLVASVFIMDWVIRGSHSADLWAVYDCGDAFCKNGPNPDAHAATAIWQTLLFSALVLWQGGARALGFRPSVWVTLAGFLVGALGMMSLAVIAAIFSRGSGLTYAPFVLAAAYVTGFVTLRIAGRDSLAAVVPRARVQRG